MKRHLAQVRTPQYPIWPQAPLEPDLVDGTLAGLARFLAEMAQLSGGAGPGLELVLGDIVAVATATAAPQAGLTITARLAVGEGACASRLQMRAAPVGCALLWHGDEGGLVLVRHVALARLRSEPAVFDAILDTAELAQGLLRA